MALCIAKELIHRKPEEVLLTNIQTHISSTTKPNLLPDLLSSPTTINVDAIEDYIADLALDVIGKLELRCVHLYKPKEYIHTHARNILLMTLSLPCPWLTSRK